MTTFDYHYTTFPETPVKRCHVNVTGLHVFFPGGGVACSFYLDVYFSVFVNTDLLHGICISLQNVPMSLSWKLK
jgi:hypothetical protein